MAGSFLEEAPGCSPGEPVRNQWEIRPESGRTQPRPPEELQGRQSTSVLCGTPGSYAPSQVLLGFVCLGCGFWFISYVFSLSRSFPQHFPNLFHGNIFPENLDLPSGALV